MSTPEQQKALKKVRLIAKIADDTGVALLDHIEETEANFEQLSTALDSTKSLVEDAIASKIDGKDGESIVGPKGDTGPVGPRGEKGDKGDRGETGPVGPRGLDGQDGKDGIDGQDGEDGSMGLVGPIGPTGKTPAHEWFGASLRFETPEGKWGPWANLQGPAGQSRGSQARELIIRSSGSLVANDAQSIDFSGATVTRQGNGVLVTVTGGVTSVNGLSGEVTLTTTNIAEGTNLYYTDARARASISATAPLSYVSATGVLSFDTATVALTKYVLKTGDTMTGTLNIYPGTDVNALTLKPFGTSTAIKTLDVKDSSSNSWFYVRKRLLSDANTGVGIDFTTSGTGSTARGGLVINMAAGYTGAEFTGVLGFDSAVAGAATYYLADATTYGYRPGGNRGIGGFARGVTTGHNIGGMMLAGGGAINYGIFAGATVTKASSVNVGVFANAHNASGTSPSWIGLYATCFNTNLTTPPNMTGIQTPLLVDNQSYTCPIAIFRSAGVSFVSIEDAGQLLLGNRLSTTSLGRLFNVPADIATTDATLTVAESYTTASDTMYTVESTLTIQSSDRTKGGTILLMGTFKNVAGTVTQIGVTVVLNNTITDAGITGAFTISGTAIRVSVTGLAATNIRFQNTFVINRVKY